jgi:hypothetical protein
MVLDVEEINGTVDYEPEIYDGYITSQVMLPKGDEFIINTVVQRKMDADGNPTGKGNTNPILDKREYKVEFPDAGEVLEYSANIIAETCTIKLIQKDVNTFLWKIKSDASAVPKDDKIFELKGRQVQKKTTKGWKLCIQWRDGSTSWEALATVREFNPPWQTRLLHNPRFLGGYRLP